MISQYIHDYLLNWNANLLNKILKIDVTNINGLGDTNLCNYIPYNSSVEFIDYAPKIISVT